MLYHVNLPWKGQLHSTLKALAPPTYSNQFLKSLTNQHWRNQPMSTDVQHDANCVSVNTGASCCFARSDKVFPPQLPMYCPHPKALPPPQPPPSTRDTSPAFQWPGSRLIYFCVAEHGESETQHAMLHIACLAVSVRMHWVGGLGGGGGELNNMERTLVVRTEEQHNTTTVCGSHCCFDSTHSSQSV